MRLAAAARYPRPLVLSGAAALLISVPLPLKNPRQRKSALAFAMEPHLATALEATSFALGPQMPDGNWLCAAVGTEFLDSVLSDQTAAGPVLVETLAVPCPDEPDVWALWCGPDTAHVRLHDGSAFSTQPDALFDLWRAFGRPKLHLVHGDPPAELEIAKTITDISDPDPIILQMDLRPVQRSRHLRQWLPMARFAAIILAAAGLAHAGLLHLDALALTRLVEDRSAPVQARISDRTSGLTLSQPTKLLMAGLTDSASGGATTDPFLRLLSHSAEALAAVSDIEFRSLNFDATSATLTATLVADTLERLQQAETALATKGLTVTGGTATRGEAGAELQLVISEGT